MGNPKLILSHHRALRDKAEIELLWIVKLSDFTYLEIIVGYWSVKGVLFTTYLTVTRVEATKEWVHGFYEQFVQFISKKENKKLLKKMNLEYLSGGTPHYR